MGGKFKEYINVFVLKGIDEVLSLLNNENAILFGKKFNEENDSDHYLLEVFNFDFLLSIKVNRFCLLYILNFDKDCVSYEIDFENEENIFREENLGMHESLHKKVCFYIENYPMNVNTRFVIIK